VETDPAGLPVRLQGEAPAPAPRSVTVLEGSTVAAAVEPLEALAGTTYRFAGWSDGSPAAARLVVVRADTVLRAGFRPVVAGGPGEVTPTPTPEAPAPISEPAARPALSLLAPRRRALARTLRLRARCTGAPCDLRATATLRAGALRRTLRPSAGATRAGRAAVLTLRLGRAYAPARRALRRGRRVSLRVVVTATGADGRRSVGRATIALR
jgi:hypothetical protein